MSDDYLRVVRTSACEWIAAASHQEAAHKVVPADAIVIERGNLPEVIDVPMMQRFETLPEEDGHYAEYGDSPDERRKWALHHFALAEHLAAHPPIDEAQIEALAAALDATTGLHTIGENRVIARRLVEQGWTKPEPKP